MQQNESTSTSTSTEPNATARQLNLLSLLGAKELPRSRREASAMIARLQQTQRSHALLARLRQR